jgi:hypothetical protein
MNAIHEFTIYTLRDFENIVNGYAFVKCFIHCLFMIGSNFVKIVVVI